MSDPRTILIVRLGAMGDIIQTLPAAASLRRSFPNAQITWVLARKWLPILEGNPNVDRAIPFDRKTRQGLLDSWHSLRPIRPDIAIDFQGLIQSALVGKLTSPRRFIGLDRRLAREGLASLFYSQRIAATGVHRVERYLELAAAAGAVAHTHDQTHEAWLPKGEPEGELPSEPFILASPFAGWAAKQWPLAHYADLAQRLRPEGLPLVVNVPPEKAPELEKIPNIRVHSSRLPGLIHATRLAAAVVGVDSGPLHLAAALNKPGVAIFGPTDPAQNGPYRSQMTVLRSANAETTYKRGAEISASMKEITASQVAEALLRSMAK